MKSMTGYARVSDQIDDVNIMLEIKSVNSKGLDVKTRMNDLLARLDYEIASYLRKKIGRGKVYFKAEVSFPKEWNFIRLNWSSIDMYSDAIEQIREKKEFKKEISPVEIMRFPDVMRSELDDTHLEKLRNMMFSMTDRLLKEFDSSREKEGKELQIFFETSVKKMKQEIDNIDSLIEKQRQEVRKRLMERAQEFLSEPFDNKRFEEELLYYIEKMDITEEIVRLKSHFIMFEKELKRQKNGKKIDFILQEINRETNTIASKSQNNGIIETTINMKDMISQMREQAANIE